jgi:ribosome-associated translation inhibitor RaiA
MKFNFLASHLDYFPANLEAVSVEQSGSFHKYIKEKVRRLSGKVEREQDGRLLLDVATGGSRRPV